MKFLCICARGNSRSAALAWILKDVLSQDAIAMGMTAAGDDTKAMLYAWADVIIVVDQEWLPQVPEEYRTKTAFWHVGGDRFFRAFDPELLNMYAVYLAQSGLAPLLLFREDVPRVVTIEIAPQNAPEAATGSLGGEAAL